MVKEREEQADGENRGCLRYSSLRPLLTRTSHVISILTLLFLVLILVQVLGLILVILEDRLARLLPALVIVRNSDTKNDENNDKNIRNNFRNKFPAAHVLLSKALGLLFVTIVVVAIPITIVMKNIRNNFWIRNGALLFPGSAIRCV